MLGFDSARGRIRALSVVFIAASVFFWAWALLNCLQKGFDLGVFSFLTTLVAGVYAFRVQRTPTFEGAGYAAYAAQISSLVVSLNYVMGLAFVHRLGFQIYCGIFAALWALGGWALSRELHGVDPDRAPSAAYAPIS